MTEERKAGRETARRPPVEDFEEEVIDLGEIFSILRKDFWKIAGISLGAGVLTFLFLLTRPNLYKSTAVIMPAEEENKQSVALGALSSLGIQVGGPTKVEDLEVLFKSDDLTVRVFTRHDHWATILGDSYDPKTKKVEPGFFSFLSSGRREPGPPTDWDAIRAAEDAKRVSLNRKTGSLTISFESTSPEESAAILTEYLDEAKSRLQEEAFARAAKNKKFIEEQIGKTVDPLTRDRLYALLGQEVEREMMARNREQFGFRVFDAPRVPDRKSRPRRGVLSLVVTFFFGLIMFVFFIVRSRHQAVMQEGVGPADRAPRS
ncbi:MAG: Wzz/FepE/Etk N-terminal domain-containing protein [Deltaproteobacteria bacterium]